MTCTMYIGPVLTSPQRKKKFANELKYPSYPKRGNSDPELGRIKQIYDMHNVYWACVNTLSAHPVYIRDEPRK